MNKNLTACWSNLGLGTGTLASLGRAASFRDVTSLLSKMSDIGVNLIDTSDSYGSGACERLLGRAMKRVDGRFHVITKAGFRIVDLPPPFGALAQVGKKVLHATGHRQNYNPSYINRALDASLRRLGVPHVDCFLLHNPPVPAVKNPEMHAALALLVQSGKARAVGVSSPKPEVLREALSHEIFSVIQAPADPGSLPRFANLWEDRRNITVMGNHVFNPATLARLGGDREKAMKLSCALLPDTGVMLCGTRNPEHLAQSAAWANQPYEREYALSIIREINQA
jgi:aryl-alcohol dehydrogenase-like predicted oxidoreductase